MQWWLPDVPAVEAGGVGVKSAHEMLQYLQAMPPAEIAGRRRKARPACGEGAAAAWARGVSRTAALQVHSLGMQAVWLGAPLQGHHTAADLAIQGLCAASPQV